MLSIANCLPDQIAEANSYQLCNHSGKLTLIGDISDVGNLTARGGYVMFSNTPYVWQF